MFKKFGKKVCSLLLAVVLLTSLVSFEAFAAETPVMEVTVGSTTTPYTDFGDGWVAALNSSTSAPTTIKLLADWVAPQKDGIASFYYEDAEGDEFGTDEGRLHLDDEDINLTIDLNGHNIDRNLGDKYAVFGHVFYIQNGNLTIKDSSGNRGKITGARNKEGEWYTDACRGGAIFIENDSVLRIEGIEISGNKTIMNYGYWPYAHGGAIYAMDDATVYMIDSVIKDNEAEHDGGAIYLWDDTNFYMSGDSIISGNICGGDGGGIYCETDGVICLTGGEISENHAKSEGTSGTNGDGGGFYISGGMCSPDIFFGGDIKIRNNTAREGAETRSDNFAIYDSFVDGFELNHAVAEQKEEDSDFINVPHAPLTEGAEIWINFDPWNLEDEDDIYLYLSDDESHFYEDSYKYFRTDFSGRLIYPVYNTEDPYEPYYEIYYVETGLVGAAPAIQNVTPLSNGPLVGVTIDHDKKEIRPVVKDDMKNFFKNITLDQLVSFTFNGEGVTILDTDKFVNLVDAPVTYKVINREGTYTLYTFRAIPQNDWADQQQPVTPLGDFKMTVRNDDTGVTTGYKNLSDGWAAAVTMARDSDLGNPAVTVTLLDNWVASNGKFSGTGTHDGRLYIDDSDIKITLDLNGYTINRAVGNTPVSNGSVFGVESGATLTIKDSSAAQTGKITGGNNKGEGGAFLIDYGRLILEGGTITGNSATYGGGIYMENGSDTSSRVDIRGGSIIGNSASKYGGGIHCYDGNLFLEGGVISGNNATEGGGMYWESANLTVWTGTTITGNNASACGGGVYAENNGNIYVGGSINITGNTANGHTDNLHLPDEISFLNIFKTAGQNPNFVPTMPFTNDAMIGMNSVDEDEYPFTTDNSRFDEKDYTHFSADDSNFVVRSVPTGDSDHPYALYLTKKSIDDDDYNFYTINFSAGAGAGSMSALTLPEHSSYTLPECGFSAPAGASFVGWSDANGGQLLYPGATFTATAGRTFVANWRFNAPANVSFTATNDNSGILSGVGSGMQYIVINLSSNTGWKDISSSSVELNEVLNGNSVIHVQYKGNNGIMASDSVIIEVDQADYRGARVQDACCGLNNGSLTHLSSDMEYSLDGSSWYAVSGDSLDNLAEGTYYVRVRAMGSVLASTKAQIAVAQLGHSFTEYSSNNDAACELDGTKTAACDYGCGTTKTITNEGSAKTHSFTNYESNNDATCEVDGTKTATCDNGCGATDTKTDEGSAKTHSFSNYVSDNNATCAANGTETAQCDHGCGATDTRTDDDSMLAHSFASEWSYNESYHWKAATCGHNAVSAKEAHDLTSADCDVCHAQKTIANYTVTVSANNSDYGTVSGGGSYLEGSSVTVTATAKDGYRFVKWRAASVDKSSEASYSFSASEDLALTAVFEAIPSYTVTVSADNDSYGTVSGGGNCLEGSTVTVTATAKDGYRFVKWVDANGDVSTSASYSFTASANVTLTAEFEAIPSYTVTLDVTPANCGTVTGGDSYREGSTVTVIATANEGYRFVGWKAGDEVVSTETSYTFTITADTTLTAVFEVIPVTTYSVNVVGGTADKSVAAEGETVTVTANAAQAGYRFAGWTSDDVSITNASSTTASFKMPAKTVTVTANYVAVYGIEVTSGGSDKATAAQGETVTVFASAAPAGQRFAGWTSESGVSFADASAARTTFEMPNHAVAVVATYEEIPPTVYTVTVVDGEADAYSAIEGAAVTITADAPEDGYEFIGWTSSDVATFADASAVTTTFTMPGRNVTVTANYRRIPTPTYTVIYRDGADGAVFDDYIFTDVAEGSATPAVEEPSRTGYTFKGWTPALEATVSGDAIYVAAWEAVSSGEIAVYGIKLEETVNGQISANREIASFNSLVILSVSADKGYTLETITVTDSRGRNIALTDMGNGKFGFRMPAADVVVEVSFMDDNTMLNFFVDVFPGDYYYDAVLWAVENGITSGTDELHFSPNATCTRAQAVTFLWRAAGCPVPESSEMPFEDVAEGSYYYDAVLWALENGITNGVSESEFGANAECTRAQIVTFLWRSLNSPEVGGEMGFGDVDAKAYYADAVLWAVENGITNGTSDSSFSPADDCIRAQIVTFLYRAMCGE